MPEEDVPRKIDLNLVKPDGVIFSGMVDSVTLPGVWGQITILPEHTTLVSTLKPGLFYYRLLDDEGKEMIEHFQIGAGYVEVSEDKVTVLTQSAALQPLGD